MTELEKLDAGLEYCFFDEEVVARKENAQEVQCDRRKRLNPTLTVITERTFMWAKIFLQITM